MCYFKFEKDDSKQSLSSTYYLYIHIVSEAYLLGGGLIGVTEPLVFPTKFLKKSKNYFHESRCNSHKFYFTDSKFVFLFCTKHFHGRMDTGNR